MSRSHAIFEAIAQCRLHAMLAARQPWHCLAAPHAPIRQYKRVKLTDRDTDLINESLSDQFGDDNPYQDTQRQYSVRDGRIRARIDQAWHFIAERTPHIRDVLVAEHGLEKTGEDVYDRGRRGTIYFDCEPTSLAYVQRYFQSAGRWLSHQLGDHLKLGKRPKFDFVYDGLTPQGEQLLSAMADATADVEATSNERTGPAVQSTSTRSTGSAGHRHPQSGSHDAANAAVSHSNADLTRIADHPDATGAAAPHVTATNGQEDGEEGLNLPGTLARQQHIEGVGFIDGQDGRSMFSRHRRRRVRPA